VNSKVSNLLSLLAAAALISGCGGLVQPDLGTGQVTGQLANAKPGAYVYAFGAPQARALVAADGSFTLQGVPVGTTKLVAFDGDSRADFVGVEVRSASRSHVEHDASQMAVARTLTAVTRCAGGQSTKGTKYTVQGTEFEDLDGGEVAHLYPLPPGSFTVTTKLAGFKDKSQQVDVSPDADAQVELDMEVDASDSKHQGCVSSGCSGSLTCDDSTGTCHGERDVCLACTSNADCNPGGATGATGVCITMPATTGGVCSHTCDPAKLNMDCPSGLACAVQADNVTFACVAQTGCDAVLAEFGKVCSANDQCNFADGQCVGGGGHGGTNQGYCSSHCLTNADCPTQLGYTCDVAATTCVH
jgi:hypothetical protein